MAKPIALGIIGLGSAGYVHYQCAVESPAFAVAAVSDPGAIDRAATADGVAAYDDWQALLDHPGMEAVSICTPHYLHGPMTTAALERGLHVLLEKPLAAELKDAERIVIAARDARRVLMVEMTHRFYPPMREAKRFFDEGRLGRLYAVEDRVIEPVPDSLPAWMSDRAKAGGGVALTNGIHMLDRIAFMTGQALTLIHGTIGCSVNRGDVEDTAAMLLKLEDGTPVQLLAAWPTGPGLLDDELTLYGANGTLRIGAWRGWQFDPLGATGQFHASYPPESGVKDAWRVGFSAAMAEFAQAVRTGRPVNPDPQEVLAAQRIVEAYYRSCRDDPAM